MGHIAVHEFIWLDGVIEAPLDDGLSLRPEYRHGDRRDHGIEQGAAPGPPTSRVETASSTQTAADNPGAPFMNDTPVSVVEHPVERRVEQPEILGPYSPEAIRALKERIDGGIS